LGRDLLDKEQPVPLRGVEVRSYDGQARRAFVGHLGQQAAGQDGDDHGDVAAGSRLGVLDRVGDKLGDK
jgi:hypothetical protein